MAPEAPQSRSDEPRPPAEGLDTQQLLDIRFGPDGGGGMTGTVSLPSRPHHPPTKEKKTTMFNVDGDTMGTVTWRMQIDEAKEVAEKLEAVKGDARAEEMAFDLRQGVQIAISKSGGRSW